MNRDLMRERLLDAAERVLRERGARHATVRAITGAAEVNVATVTTAFGGRSQLLDELFARLLEPINQERNTRYRALPESRTIEDVIRAFVEPLVPVLEEDKHYAVQELLYAVLTDSDANRRPLERVLADPGVDRFARELLHHLPDTTDRARQSLVRLAVGAILAFFAIGDETHSSEAAEREVLIRFVAAGVM